MLPLLQATKLTKKMEQLTQCYGHSGCTYYTCMKYYAVFTLDAGLPARSQYSEGPATGHFDTGFSCSGFQAFTVF